MCVRTSDLKDVIKIEAGTQSLTLSLGLGGVTPTSIFVENSKFCQYVGLHNFHDVYFFSQGLNVRMCTLHGEMQMGQNFVISNGVHFWHF